MTKYGHATTPKLRTVLDLISLSKSQIMNIQNVNSKTVQVLENA